VKDEFSPQNFEKSSNMKFHENTPTDSRVAQCGHTDGRTYKRDEGNRRFSKFFEHA
jgi:hypothetical protein